MSWSYGANPSSDTKDAVRLYIGDTDSTDQLLQDEEINFFLQTEGAPRLAAVRACEAIAAKFSRLADESVGRVRVSFNQKSQQYLTLAKQLKQSYEEGAAVPFAGGVSITSKETTVLDSDRVRPSFTRDTHDNPRNPDNFEDEESDYDIKG